MPCGDDIVECGPKVDCGCSPTPTPTPTPTACSKLAINGLFTNATVTVENGCITKVEDGEPYLYTPDPCCASPGGGGTGSGIPGDKGDDGADATVTVGTVTTGSPGSAVEITNVGTANQAVLNFKIPAGVAGPAGASPTGNTSNVAGIDIQNGLVKTLPTNWPPLLNFTNAVTSGPKGTSIAFVKDPATGAIAVTLDDAAVYNALLAHINTLATRVATLENQFTTLNDNATALAARVTATETSIADHEARLVAGGL